MTQCCDNKQPRHLSLWKSELQGVRLMDAWLNTHYKMLSKDFDIRLILFFVFLCFVQTKVEALQCYTCTATAPNSDCQLHPEKVAGGITNCNKKYCTLRRVEYIDTGAVYSFYRSCEDNPVYTNTIIEDPVYRTYFYACSSALCNGGAGKQTNSDSQNNLPPGVTKPPFNMGVLHVLESSLGVNLEPFKITILTALLTSLSVAWCFRNVHF